MIHSMVKDVDTWGEIFQQTVKRNMNIFVVGTNEDVVRVQNILFLSATGMLLKIPSGSCQLAGVFPAIDSSSTEREEP